MSEIRGITYYRTNPTYCTAKVVNGWQMWRGEATVLCEWTETRRFGRETRDYSRLRVLAPDGKQYSPLLSMVEPLVRLETPPEAQKEAGMVERPFAPTNPLPAPVLSATAASVEPAASTEKVIQIADMLRALNDMKPDELLLLQSKVNRLVGNPGNRIEKHSRTETLKNGTIAIYEWELEILPTKKANGRPMIKYVRGSSRRVA